MNGPCAPIDLCDGSVGELVNEGASGCPLLEPGEPGGVRQAEARALEQVINRRITQRTWGRLQFRVRLGAGRVIIQGSSPTYYLKQLALAAVREVLSSAPVELDIRVAKAGISPDPVIRQAVLVP
jgi:hypothetical protein